MREVNCMNCIVTEFRDDLCEEEFCEKFRCARGNKDFVEHVLEVARPHGEWVDVPKYNGFYVCSKCLERLDGDFERFDHWEMKKENFCPVCGSDNRERGKV